MGVDKATLAVEGVPLALRAAGTLAACGVAPVVAVGGRLAALAEAGLPGVADTWPGEGPLGGILTALRWCPAPRLAVVACDLVSLDAATVGALLDEAAGPVPGRGPAVVVASGPDGRLQPLASVWDVARVVGVLDAVFSSGERGVQRALTQIERVLGRSAVAAVRVAPSQLRNANTPADLGIS
jgi:molybdopterin-guanine dinucleotide biosynthesis protein A